MDTRVNDETSEQPDASGTEEGPLDSPPSQLPHSDSSIAGAPEVQKQSYLPDRPIMPDEQSQIPHDDPPPYTDVSWNGTEIGCNKTLAPVGEPRRDSCVDDGGVAGEVGRDLARLFGSTLRLSASIPLLLSQTFHEIPRLYGDETVREHGSVTDMKSGFRTAGSVFTLGVYDGVSGFFVQPYEGARKGGVKGFCAGFGKGLGGIVCKPVEGGCGLVGYGLTGVAKDCQKASRRVAGRGTSSE